MTYAKVEDGEIVAFGLPSVGTLPDGSQVSGFDKLSDDELKEAGWVPVEEPAMPKHDKETQQIQASEYVIEDGKVTRTLSVVNKPPEDPQEAPKASLEDRISALEAFVEGLKK